MVGGFFATNVGATRPLGIDGWRFAFHLMATVSIVTAALVLNMASDPRHNSKVSYRTVLGHLKVVKINREPWSL